MLTKISLLIALTVTVIILALSIRGNPGNPTETDLGLSDWKENGPFELSPERGRFALLYSLAENKTYHLSPYLAAFVAPDVAVAHDYFASLFPPGLTYTLLPGYEIGKNFSISQVGATAMISLMATINIFLVYLVCRRFGAHPLASVIASLTFLFATPAFTYAVTIYQHHLTTFLLLIALLTVRSKNLLASLLFWFVTGYAFLVDTPNAVFFLPICVFWFLANFTVTQNIKQTIISISFPRIFTFLAVLVPLVILGKFNLDSFGTPWILPGTNQRATEIRLDVDPLTGKAVATSEKIDTQSGEKKSVGKFFKTRSLMNGLYTHIFAMDRGLIFFAPVILIGILGVPIAYRKNKYFSTLILMTISVIILLYSMWGDPYGGWAFGSRYLIPAYALFMPFVALAITAYIRFVPFLILFVVAFLYSLGVNTVGALTTSAIPPRVELTAIREKVGKPMADGYISNFILLKDGESKSYLYRTVGSRYVSSMNYGWTIFGITAATVLLNVAWLYLDKRGNRHEDTD